MTMEQTIKKLQELLNMGTAYFMSNSELEYSKKEIPEKWSKKETLGHLIDSGINNLQRFTEIQFKPKPFKISSYNQDQLVIANNYQNADTEGLIDFWIAINERIIQIMSLQTEDTLSYSMELTDGSLSDLKFLMKDYVAHMDHHLDQIFK